MFNCYVDLYIFNFDTIKKQLQIVSLEKNSLSVPSIMMDNSQIASIQDAIKEIVSNYLICNISQIKPRLFDVSIEQEMIRIKYITTSPIDLVIVNSYYLDVETFSYENKNLRKALLYV